MTHQLETLVGPDFLRTTPRRHLPDLPRYLDAMAQRLQNLHGRVERDRAGIEKVAVWERRLTEVKERAGDGFPETVTALRFLVEEFRVATFAQRIGTREKVSEKRLARRFDAATALLQVP